MKYCAFMVGYNTGGIVLLGQFKQDIRSGKDMCK